MQLYQFIVMHLLIRNDKKIIVNSIDFNKSWSANNLNDALRSKMLWVIPKFI